MEILIVEDEPRAAEWLKALFHGIDPAHQIVGTTTSIQNTIDWLNNHAPPDLIMMDIHLADGECFSIFEVCEVSAPIIFCTAYDEYALEAFRANGIGYLLKPAAEKDLRAALLKLDRLQQSLSKRQATAHQQVLRHLGIGNSSYKSRFLIKVGEKLLPVPTEDIACFVLDPHGMKAHMLDRTSYYIEYSLAELCGVLDPRQFYQISRQAIVHGQAISSTSANLQKTSVRLEAIQLQLPVSRSRAKAFRQWLETAQ